MFTKIFKPIVTFLKKRGLRLIIYLDNILLLNTKAEGAELYYTSAVSLLEEFGLLINLEKSVGSPRQVLEFLGLIVNSRYLSLSL